MDTIKAISFFECKDGVNLFDDLFLAILMTLEEIFFNLEGRYNKDTSVKANSLLKLILNFHFIVKLVISRLILDYTIPWHKFCKVKIMIL